MLSADDTIEQLRAVQMELDRRKAIRAGDGLLTFTRATMPEFEESWHHKVACDFLDRFAAGLIPRGMIFMPPRHTKSELVSRRLPARLLGKNPYAKIIAGSYSADLAGMMSRDVQNIMQSDAYQRIFPGVQIGGVDKKQTEHLFEIKDNVGYYRGTGIGGGITGMGASYAIIDDPIKSAEEAESAVFRDKIWKWYTSTLYTRLERPGSILLTMTRWHLDDLAGRLLQKAADDPNADQWEVLVLPAIAEGGNVLDPRLPGEALWPSRYPFERLQSIRTTLGTQYWQAMYQQQPIPSEGGDFQRAWLSNIVEACPAAVRNRIRRWDVAATTGGGDYTAGVRMSIDHEGIIYIENVVRGQWGPHDVDRIMRAVAQIDGRDTIIREEQEPGSSGKAVIAARARLLSGFIYSGSPATGEKRLRWRPLAAQAEAGNVRLVRGPWNEDFISELIQLPSGKNDDQGDAAGGAYNDLTGHAPMQVVSLQGFN